MRGEISNAIDNLEPKHWAVFTMHALDELTHGQIWHEVGISEAASQKCHQRTRNKLAQCLDDEPLVVMPFVALDCHDKRIEPPSSHWSWAHHRVHHTGQLASLVTRGMPALLLETKPRMLNDEVPTLEWSIAAMVPQDKPVPVMPGKTVEQRDKPLDKRESAPALKIPLVRRMLETTIGKPMPTT